MIELLLVAEIVAVMWYARHGTMGIASGIAAAYVYVWTCLILPRYCPPAVEAPAAPPAPIDVIFNSCEGTAVASSPCPRPTNT